MLDFVDNPDIQESGFDLTTVSIHKNQSDDFARACTTDQSGVMVAADDRSNTPSSRMSQSARFYGSATLGSFNTAFIAYDPSIDFRPVDHEIEARTTDTNDISTTVIWKKPETPRSCTISGSRESARSPYSSSRNFRSYASKGENFTKAERRKMKWREMTKRFGYQAVEEQPEWLDRLIKSFIEEIKTNAPKTSLPEKPSLTPDDGAYSVPALRSTSDNRKRKNDYDRQRRKWIREIWEICYDYVEERDVQSFADQH